MSSFFLLKRRRKKSKTMKIGCIKFIWNVSCGLCLRCHNWRCDKQQQQRWRAAVVVAVAEAEARWWQQPASCLMIRIVWSVCQPFVERTSLICYVWRHRHFDRFIWYLSSCSIYFTCSFFLIPFFMACFRRSPMWVFEWVNCAFFSTGSECSQHFWVLHYKRICNLGMICCINEMKTMLISTHVYKSDAHASHCTQHTAHSTHTRKA